MQENDKPVLIYSTFPSPEAAEAVGQQLVAARLAACVNILPGMTSIYRWEGAIARESEAVMIIKTRASLALRVMEMVKASHSYANPALRRTADPWRIGRLSALVGGANGRRE